MLPISLQAQKSSAFRRCFLFAFGRNRSLLFGGLCGGLLGFDLDEGVLEVNVPAALLFDLHEIDPDHIADGDYILELVDEIDLELGDV